jgi:hypothetical protein
MYGNTQYELSFDPKQRNQYAQVISVRLRKILIQSKTFTNQEALFILENTQKKILGMRIPDLDYVIMNRFEDLKN